MRSGSFKVGCVLWAASFLGGCTDVRLIEGSTALDVGAAEVGAAVDAGLGYDPGLLVVETGVSDDAPSAGEAVQIFCSVIGLPDGADVPATTWTLVDAPAGAQEPAQGDDALTFSTSGAYLVQCGIDATGYKDPSPAKIVVSAASATAMTTQVDPQLLKAGQLASVTCTGVDAFGNLILAWHVVITGGLQGGLVSSAMSIKGLTVGTYDVACAQDGGATDAHPVEVRVEHGLPTRIKTFLDAVSIEAGGQTGLSCEAEDAYGNDVPDLPMTVSLPEALAMTGLSVGGTLAGTYPVTCVPAGLDWGAFVLEKAILEVVAGPAVTLELSVMPPKPFFGTYEKLTLVPLAQDTYGNLVLEPLLSPVVVTPDEHWKDKGELSYLFQEEGFYTLTLALANDPSQAAWVDVAIEGEPPALTITHPERAETLVGAKPSVTVKGFAVDAVAGIEKVLVNGQEATLAEDGSFTKIVIPEWGLNLLTVEAVDAGGAVTVIKQTFVFAEAYYAMGPELPEVPDALKLWLSKEFVDDGVHNPTHVNDMATVLEADLANLDLSSVLSDNEIGAGYSVELKNLSFNPPKVNLTPIWGGLHLNTIIKNFHIDLKLKGECKVLGIDLCPDFSGSVEVQEIVVDSDLMIAAQEGVIDTHLESVKVTVGYIDLEIDGILGWLFDWVIDFIVNAFSAELEDAFKAQVEDELGDQVKDLLEKLAMTDTFELDGLLPGMPPTELTYDTRVWSAAFSPHGGRLSLAGRFLTSKQVPFDIEGSIARGTCLKGFPVNWQVPGQSNFEAAIDDDFLNLALTSLWYQGVMKITMDSDSVGDGEGFDLGGLPVDDFTLDVTFLLPPILNGCRDETLLYLQMGDIFLDAELVSPLFEGGVAKIGSYVTIELSAEILTNETDEGTSILIHVMDLETLVFHWEYVPVEFEGSEDILEDLLKDALIDKMLEGLVGKSLGDFQFPDFDLGSGAGGNDTVINTVIEDLNRQSGHTLIKGYLD